MDFEWDPGKRSRNLLKHGLDFHDAARIFEGSVFTKMDTRENYGETRFITVESLNGRVVVVVHAARGNTCRVISMRKANERESKKYQEQLETP